ncbi:similar to hypothetical protein FLJ25359, isoform CRA_c [Rattus norvegicus]|uniref:Uncharacterized protein RGD1311454 n=1 Tax=Rattus norvegicus TaxID=10116 RepID=A6IA43_RAT|nr:similar to hypothetical protein FLJ25359, isoform CRA_c [Rattus norvegicus]
MCWACWLLLTSSSSTDSFESKDSRRDRPAWANRGVFFAAYLTEHSSFLEFLHTKPDLEPRKRPHKTHTDAVSVLCTLPK